MKKAEAVALLKQWKACPGAMDRLGKHRSVAKMIEAATFDDLEWVLSQIGGAALAEYEKVRGAALAEYEKARGPALAEYEKVRGAALAEYEKVRGAAWAECEKVRDAAARKILLAWCDAGVLP